MTVSSETYRVQYAGNGVTVAFTVPWRFLANSHVLAIHTNASGTDTTWVEGTHYTLTGAGAATGTLTAKTTPTDYTPATGARLTIVRDLPLTQTTDYISNDDFPAQTHEDDHDKFVMLLQQVQEQLDRTVRIPKSSTDAPLTDGDIEEAIAALSADVAAAGLRATSTTSLAIGTGTKVFTTQADKAFEVGDYLLVVSDANPTTKYMLGKVTAYAGTALDLSVTAIGGSGTLTDWTLRLSGGQGQTGASGAGTGDLLAANNLSDVASASTSFANIKQTASATATGVVELATDAETITGTDTGRGVTPANVQAKLNGMLSSQAEAEAATLNTVLMTPLRTKQSITAWRIPDLIIRDEKTNGTAGGTSTSGGIHNRNLNTVMRDVTGGASLASDVITLQAGSYYCRWSCPAYKSDQHQTRLLNNTDTLSYYGSSEQSGSADTTQTRSVGEAIFTIAGSKAFILQHGIQTGFATTGLGVSCPAFTAVEVYSIIEIWKQ